MIRFHSITLQIAFLVFLSLHVSAFAASTITLSASGDGVFQLQGVNIEKAAAIDVTIAYDTATLTNPRIVAGPFISGAMTAVNPNVPGTLRIAIIRTAPVTGSGLIATLSFDLMGNSQGKITSLNAKLANINGAPITAQVQINNLPDAPVSAANASQQQDITSETGPPRQKSTGAIAAPIVPPAAIITMGQPEKIAEVKSDPDGSGVKERDSQDVAPLTKSEPIQKQDIVARGTDTTVTSGSTASAAPKTDSHLSVLDRFKAYHGERTAKALISLFSSENMIGYQQEPSIALTDGKFIVKVSFLSTPGSKASPDIAVMGARLVSLRRDAENINWWVVELIPEKGKYQAGFAVAQGQVKTTYPLTVAPKATIKSAGTGAVSETDFKRFLKAGEKAMVKKFDLNGDGKRDYIDDYIFTANYIVAVKKRK